MPEQKQKLQKGREAVMKGTLASCLARLSLAVQLGLLIAICACSMSTAAFAHGERNQEPFLRMRSVHFYDLKWSTEKTAVNGEVTISGKFRLFTDWPNNVPKPEKVFLGNGTPGPVFARTESWINDEPAIQSGRLEINRDYSFRTVLKAREPGMHHVHPMLNVMGAGPLLGPGRYVEVTGNADDFRLPATTIDGIQIADLSNWGVGMVVKWHLLWVVVALAYMLWFLRKPLLIPRYLAIEAGNEDKVITNKDRLWGAGFLVFSVVVVIAGAQWAQSAYPHSIPLQGGEFKVEPLPLETHTVSVRVKRATYDVPGRSMKIQAEITNNGPKSVQIGEFMTANLRFVNRSLPAEMAMIDPSFPTDLLPPTGLQIDDQKPLAAGETRLVTLEATDAAWEVERLTSLMNDPDNRVGGLLFLFDPDGKRLIANVFGPIVPVFKRT
jgi:methane/ammonia monooxygenase subunit B